VSDAVEPRWLDRRRVVAIHTSQIREHGGASGIRDEGLLESALARPQHHWSYTRATVPQLAAICALALAKNHPFVDGNKRTAFVALELFLGMNGHEFVATDADSVVMMLRVASSDVSDEDFGAWVADNSRPRV